MTAYASYRSRRSTSMVKENNQRGAHQAVSFVSSREQIVVAYPSVTIGPTFLLCSHKDNTPIMYTRWNLPNKAHYSRMGYTVFNWTRCNPCRTSVLWQDCYNWPCFRTLSQLATLGRCHEISYGITNLWLAALERWPCYSEWLHCTVARCYDIPPRIQSQPENVNTVGLDCLHI